MGSLKDCLKKIYGFDGSPEAAAVAKKAAELRKEGYTGKEADTEAVKFFINQLADERAAVMEQVYDQAEAPEPPGQQHFDFASEAETGRADSRGEYATENAEEPPAGGSYKEMTVPFIDLPELVEFAKELSGGKYPLIRNLLSNSPGVMGQFQYPSKKSKRGKGKEKILLKRDLFKDWKQAAATLAHEIGHWVDYIPDLTVSRGNILGHLAGLYNYTKHTLPKAPGAPGELTTEDRRRLKAEAKKLLEAESKDKFIDEEITKSMPITADDILAIWNAAAKTSEQNQDLYRYIAKLDTAAKKAVVKEALKGQVKSELQQFAKIVREKTGKQIPYTPTEQDLLKKYEDLIAAELKKRQLLDNEEIMLELKGLSRAWKPFDPQMNPAFTRYRYDPKELYADAFSALMNSPELVRNRAPKWYEAFFNYLETRPEAAELYRKITDRMAAGTEDDVLSQRIRAAWSKHNNIYGKELEGQAEKDILARDLIDANWFLIKRVHEIGPRNIKPGENPQYKMEDLAYTGSEIEWLMTDTFRNVVRPLEKAGLSWMDLEEYSFHRRITAPKGEFGGRTTAEGEEMANPFGVYRERSEKRLAKWEAGLRPAQWAALKKAHEQMHTIRQYVIDKMEKEGVFDQALIDKMRDAVNYARFDIADYLEKKHGRAAGLKIFRQYGTLKENAGPATATLMKDISAIKAVNRAAAAKSVAKFLAAHYPTDVWRIQKNRFGQIQEPKEPGRGMIAYLEGGRLKAYNVPAEIAEIFDENPVASALVTRALRKAGNFFRTIFTEINPGYWLFNIKRDFSRVQANVPGVWGAGTVRFAKEWWAALKPAMKSVFGIPDPVIKEMQQNNMLISVADIRGMKTEDQQIEKLLKSYHLRPMNWKHHVVNPFGSAFTYWSNIGRGFERTTKVAGYRYLKKRFPDMAQEEIAHLIRNTGSPDFLRGGTWTPLTNNLFLFSNAMVQGYRGDLEAMVSRGKLGFTGWWAKRLYRIALPKLLMFAASIGMLGDDVERIFAGISEYDKTNYIDVPLGLTNNGRSVYIRVPVDETGRFIGGIIHKALNFQKPGILSALADYTAGQAPTLNPILDILFDTVAYASGLNPYNKFYGRYAIPETAFLAGGERSHTAFLEYIAKKAGSQSIYKFQTDDVEKVKGELQSILGWNMSGDLGKMVKIGFAVGQAAAEAPVLSNIVGRFLKESNYGQMEQSREARKEVTSRRAEETLGVRDAVNRMVSGKPATQADREALAASAKTEIINQVLSGRKIKPGSLPGLEQKLERNTIVALGKKYGNVFVQEYYSAQSAEERVAVLKTFARMNGQLAD